MEVHTSIIKSENQELLSSPWDHGAWNEFSGPIKSKIESVPTVVSTEQLINKPTSFPQTENINNIDKVKSVRECFKCDQCQETMANKQVLRHHKNSAHNEKKTFRCTVESCVRAFTSANYLKNHVDIEHTDCSGARIPCPKKDCGLVFPNNYRLKRHIRQDHRLEKLYQCQMCARKFASLEVRNNHMKAKHATAPARDNFSVKMLDSNYYRTDQNKESENDTVYAASPISSRFDSINGQSSIDTTCEAQWLTKTCDSNPPLSKQIDKILCDIFSDKYQEAIHSPLSSSELAMAIVSLEKSNEDNKKKPLRTAPNFNPLMSGQSSPLKSSYIFNELDRKMSTSQNRLTSNQNSIYNGTLQISQNNMNNVSMTGQNYPQSNTESEGHSTESQRSFFVNSSQHEEFSDISMESHMKDVFSNAVDKWNVCGTVVNGLDNPIKLLEYTCLDTMFDDFHEIIASDHVNTYPYTNVHSSNQANLSHIPGQKNHLLSLNNMHSKFLGASQFNNMDHQHSRSNVVPSNQISNYEVNKRKMNSCFPNNKVHPAPYDINSPYNKDPNLRDPSFPHEVSSRCHGNPMVNGSMYPHEEMMMRNYPQGYSYGSNQQLMANNQMYYNRDPSTMYIQQPGRPPYPLCFNASNNSNSIYQNFMDTDFINESMSQTSPFPNVFRRRAPPVYQAGFTHQMLPSQHPASSSSSSSAAAVPVSYCPPPSIYRSSNFHGINRGVFTDSAAPAASFYHRYQQQQQPQQRHLLSSNKPIIERSKTLQNNNNNASAAIDNNPFIEGEESILSEEQSSTVISNEKRSQFASSSSLGLQGPSQSLSCDISDVNITVCM